MDAATLDAVREVIDAANEKLKWDALAPSVADLEKRAGALFRDQSRDVKRALVSWRSKWPVREDALPERIAEFIDRVLAKRRGRDAERLRPPLRDAMKAALTTIGSAKWGISFKLEDVRGTAFAKQRGAELVRELNRTTVADIRSILARGISEGWSYDRVAKEIIAKYASYAAARGQRGIRTRAHLIAVTESAFAYERSHLAQAQMLEASGLPMLKEWGVSGDERDCEICEGNAGEGAIPLGQDFSSGDAMPPAHPACVVGSARVLATAVSAATQRLYDGPLVVLGTALGYELACTPNHPILTPRGWVAAGELDEGDHILSCRDGEWMPAGVDEHHDASPAMIHEVAQAFRQALPVTAREVETAAEDFHGDGAGSEVAVVWANGFLRDTRIATLREHGRKPALVWPHVCGIALAAGRSLAACLETATTPAGRESAHGQVLADGRGGDAVSPSNSGTGEARNVVVDELLHKLIRERWTGHVFNLQTASETYFAAGILTHNCRCWSGTYVDPSTPMPDNVTVNGQTVTVTI